MGSSLDRSLQAMEAALVFSSSCRSPSLLQEFRTIRTTWLHKFASKFFFHMFHFIMVLVRNEISMDEGMLLSRGQRYHPLPERRGSSRSEEAQ